MVRRWQVAIVYLLVVVLLTACNAATSSSSPKVANSPSAVAPLTRIAQGEGAFIVSDKIAVNRGQIVYVPAYSHIYHGDRQEEFLLAITLSIRNTSLTDAIVIRSVRYHNSDGKLVKQFAEGNLQLSPLATTGFFIPAEDSSGGSGANFIVEWVTDKKSVTEPLIEAVMISTRLQQGLSFTAAGRVIQELKPE